MFDFIKRHKRDDDFGDIRSNVVGRDFDEPDFPAARRFDSPPRGPPPGFEDPLEPRRFDDRQRFDEPQGFGSIDMSRQERAPRGDYDVTDRLNLIESQLAAIRSMTETINERLKNMESRMGLQRRY